MNSQFLQVKDRSIRYQITVAVILIATVIIGSGLILVSISSAQEIGRDQTLLALSSDYNLGAAAPADLHGPDIPTRVGAIIKAVLGLTGIILLYLLVSGGFEWMTAGGNPEKVEKARKLIISAIVGFVLIFMSYSLTILISKNFFNTNTPEQTEFTCFYIENETPLCDLISKNDCDLKNGTIMTDEQCLDQLSQY